LGKRKDDARYENCCGAPGKAIKRNFQRNENPSEIWLKMPAIGQVLAAETAFPGGELL